MKEWNNIINDHTIIMQYSPTSTIGKNVKKGLVFFSEMSGGITPTYDWALRNTHISSEYVREALAEFFATMMLMVWYAHFLT
jgi:hypothetical protein